MPLQKLHPCPTVLALPLHFPGPHGVPCPATGCQGGARGLIAQARSFRGVAKPATRCPGGSKQARAPCPPAARGTLDSSQHHRSPPAPGTNWQAGEPAVRTRKSAATSLLRGLFLSADNAGISLSGRAGREGKCGAILAPAVHPRCGRESQPWPAPSLLGCTPFPHPADGVRRGR